jgi:DnaK suppressor protein
MELTKEIIEELKGKLLEEKKNLEDELGKFAKPVGSGEFETKINDMGPDEDENASEVEEYADNLALENNFEKRLDEISAALKRIENGTYGICENCNELIGIERLRAYPAATTCINCSKN